MDENPFTFRETLLFVLPAWFVDWVLGPFPDESGWLPVIAKWGALGWITGEIVEAYELPLSPYSVLIPGLLLMAYSAFRYRD